MSSLEIPAPAVLRATREALGLSQAELAAALGFGPHGDKTVRDWEHGYRNGQPFQPTPTAWAAFRYLLMIVETLRAFGPDHPSTRKMRDLLPETLR